MVLDHPSLHGARALVADNKLKVWLDIDINGSRAAYQRAVDFVAARNLYAHAAPHCAWCARADAARPCRAGRITSHRTASRSLAAPRRSASRRASTRMTCTPPPAHRARQRQRALRPSGLPRAMAQRVVGEGTDRARDAASADHSRALARDQPARCRELRLNRDGMPRQGCRVGLRALVRGLPLPSRRQRLRCTGATAKRRRADCSPPPPRATRASLS